MSGDEVKKRRGPVPMGASPENFATRLPEELAGQVDAARAERGWTRSATLRRIIRWWGALPAEERMRALDPR